MPDVQSVAVLHRGHLAYEFYRAGVTPSSLQDVQSVTKSVLALLFGAAQADGHVRGPGELVALRLPQLLREATDPRAQRLRFAHLLTMTAGWAGEQTAKRDRDDDLRQIVRRPFVADPGTRFAYDNGAANLAALALALVAVAAWTITLPAAALVGAAMWWIGHVIPGAAGAIAIFLILLGLSGYMYARSKKDPISHDNVNAEWEGTPAAAARETETVPA